MRSSGYDAKRRPAAASWAPASERRSDTVTLCVVARCHEGMNASNHLAESIGHAMSTIGLRLDALSLSRRRSHMTLSG
jgi:hypothetical protein